MACLNTLKLEIKTVESIFTKNHERFQVLTATVDELTCRFIAPNNRRYDIHANITVRAFVFQRLLVLQFVHPFGTLLPGNIPLDAARVVRRDGRDHHNKRHSIT